MNRESPGRVVPWIRRTAASSLLAWMLVAPAPAADYVPRNGDIIFHTSRSDQSKAVQRATGSRYSHMGVVYVESGEPFVYEAVEPVKLTRLREWVNRGESGRFVVKRLRNAEVVLTPKALQKLKSEGRRFRGKSYDLYFEWSDHRIYCSELVWKMYRRALGIELGSTRSLRDFNLSDPAVKEKLRERWPKGPPLDETVVAPSDIFDSDRLVTVFAN